MCDNHPGADDCFRPPDVPTLVHCLHCGQEYESYEIVWRLNTVDPDDEEDRVPGFWCCPVPGCAGKGFGFDIFPIDPECLDERAGWFEDDYEQQAELWESLNPAFDTLLWSDVEDHGPPRVDGLLGDPTPPHFVDPTHNSSVNDHNTSLNDDELPF